MTSTEFILPYDLSLHGGSAKALEGAVRAFIKNHQEIFDVVLYGSTVIGKPSPNDIDIMILTRERLHPGEVRNLVLEFKAELKGILPGKRLDIRTMAIEDLFDPNNLASLGVIIEGLSLTRGKPLAELMNGEAYTLFRFTLRGMERKDRVRFQYALRGRDGKGGILKELGALQLGAWVVLVPIGNTYRFKEFLDLWGVGYEAFTMLKGADLFYRL